MPPELDEVSMKLLKILAERGTLHLRSILKLTGLTLSELSDGLRVLLERGFVREFRHGGYRFFSITEEGLSALSTSHLREE